MLSVPVRIDVIQWGRLYDQWLYTSSTNLMQWLQANYNIVSYDWDQEEVYRLWFRDSESALLFRLKF